MSSKLSHLVDTWYSNEDKLEFNLSRSETMAYVEILLNQSITKSALRLLGNIQLLHFISPYSNDPREPFMLPTTAPLTETGQQDLQSTIAAALEQKRTINSCNSLLSRLKRLQTSIQGLDIPLPRVFTSEVILGQVGSVVQNSNEPNLGPYLSATQPTPPQTTLNRYQNRRQAQIGLRNDLAAFQHDQLNIFTTIGTWINSVEGEEKSHLAFLNQTSQQVTLHLQFLLTIATARKMVEEILNNDFDYKPASIGSILFGHKPTPGSTSQPALTHSRSTSSGSYGSVGSHSDGEMDDYRRPSTPGHHVDGLDIESMVYQFDDNAQASISLSSSHNSSDYDIDDEDDSNTTNMIILYGCVSSASRILLNTTIHRLSRGNVHIQWQDYNGDQQRDIFSTVVQNHLLNNPDEDSDTSIIHKYLPLALNNYLSDDLRDQLPVHSTPNLGAPTDPTGQLKKHDQQDANGTAGQAPPGISSFVMIFPFSKLLYTKVLKVCSIYSAQLFKLPQLQQRSVFGSITRRNSTMGLFGTRSHPHAPQRSNSQQHNPQLQGYVDVLSKYDRLISRAQVSLHRILLARVTTFKALYQLYLDCCAYQYDSIGTIIASGEDGSNDDGDCDEEICFPIKDNSQPTVGHQSSTNNGDFSNLLQISTCLALIIEELSILQAEQYLVPFTTTTAATTTSTASLFSPGGTKLDTPGVNHSSLYGLSDTLSSTIDNSGRRSHASGMYVLRAFVASKNLPLLAEQFQSFDDNCNDGFEVKPIINFTHVYTRDWITTPEFERGGAGAVGTRSNNNTTSIASLQLLADSTPTTSNMFTIPPEPPTQFPALPLYLPAQELINTYSIPSYKELNPANVVIGTFPFIFAVMFGDVIHALMLLGVAIALYYFMYSDPSDPKLPSEKTKSMVNRNGQYQSVTDDDDGHEEEDLLHYDPSSSSAPSTKAKNYIFYSQSGSPIPITTSLFNPLYNTLLQSPVYKAVSIRKGLILWFIMIAAMSLYVGTIYNDAASNPLFLFKSYLRTQHNAPDGIDYDHYTVYPFGLDPGWMHTKEELTFLNSFKMKMAILLGITHLYSGIISNIFNHLYFKHYIHLVLSTLPQLLLLTCTFGYMSALIVYKWCTDYHHLAKLFHSGKIDVLWSPVSIIQTMINMFLTPGAKIPQAMLIFNGQESIQFVFVILAALSVPSLFIGEPIYTLLKHKAWLRKYHPTEAQQLESNYSNRYSDDDADKVESRRYLNSPNSSFSSSTATTTTTATAKTLQQNAITSSPSYSTFNTDIGIDGVALPDPNLDDTTTDDDHPARSPTTQRLIAANQRQQQQQQRQTSSTPLATVSGSPRPLSPTASEDEDEDVTEEDQLNPYSRHYTLSTHFVHHGIHSIEFVLGVVSNTASYLRLWALSLAHAQLSNVFWSQLITNLGLSPSSNPFTLCIAMMVWLFSTIGVLLCMDAMECMLHAVRLVWVEFQSKFYHGGGYLFTPFSLYPVVGERR